MVDTDLLVRGRDGLIDYLDLSAMRGSLVASVSFGDGGLWKLSGTECFLVCPTEGLTINTSCCEGQRDCSV